MDIQDKILTAPKFEGDLIDEAARLVNSHVALQAMLAHCLEEAGTISTQIASADFGGPDGQYLLGKMQGAAKGRQDYIGIIISKMMLDVEEYEEPKPKEKLPRTSDTRQPVKRSRPTPTKKRK